MDNGESYVSYIERNFVDTGANRQVLLINGLFKTGTTLMGTALLRVLPGQEEPSPLSNAVVCHIDLVPNRNLEDHSRLLIMLLGSWHRSIFGDCREFPKIQSLVVFADYITAHGLVLAIDELQFLTRLFRNYIDIGRFIRRLVAIGNFYKLPLLAVLAGNETLTTWQCICSAGL